MIFFFLFAGRFYISWILFYDIMGFHTKYDVSKLLKIFHNLYFMKFAQFEEWMIWDILWKF